MMNMYQLKWNPKCFWMPSAMLFVAQLSICYSSWILPITLTSQWARWRLKSPASGLFTQLFIQVQIKENIKAPRHWPLCGEFTGDRWILRTKGQLRGKCFHLMTSSCIKYTNPNVIRLGIAVVNLIAGQTFHGWNYWIQAINYARSLWPSRGA